MINIKMGLVGSSTTCNTNMRAGGMIVGDCLESQKEGDQWKDVDIDGRIILKRILELHYDVMDYSASRWGLVQGFCEEGNGPFTQNASKCVWRRVRKRSDP
jgi:hypothetical protein